jgi:nucleoside-diphosphate-sugar epimerase
MKRVVFNGQTGGLGRYMAAELEKANIPYTALRSRLEDLDGLLAELNAIYLFPADQVTFISLAGLVTAETCEKEPVRAQKVNVTDTTATISQFLDWGEQNGLATRVIYIGTGHVYAPKPAGQKLLETDAVAPRSVYARTKLEAENALRTLFGARMHDLIVARVFGMLSPEQRPPAVLPSLVRRVKENNFSDMAGLNFVRDYLDARDVGRLLTGLTAVEWEGLSIGGNRVVNVASGEATAVRDLFGLILDAAAIPRADVENKITAAPARPDDIVYRVGEASLLSTSLKTIPRHIPLIQTVKDAFQRA